MNKYLILLILLIIPIISATIGYGDINYGVSWTPEEEIATIIYKKSIVIEADALKAPQEKPATYVPHGLNGAWRFANAGSGNENRLNGRLRIPKDMDRSVAPVVYLGWSADGISPGDCKWQIEYVWTSPNEATNAIAQETLTAVGTASSTSNGLIITEITGIDLPSSTDACVTFKLTRLSADGQDTISDTVEVVGFELDYTANKLGEAI